MQQGGLLSSSPQISWKKNPLPVICRWSVGRELDTLAQQLAAAASREEDNRIRTRMIALQEELDWYVYHSYDLLTDAQAKDLIAQPATVPNLNLGERAFEIVLARRVERGELETQWFARHRSHPDHRDPSRTGRTTTAKSSSAASPSSSPTATSA